MRLKAALSVLPVPATKLYVNVLLASGSVVPSVPTVAFVPEFSAIRAEEMTMSIGASLTFVTLITNTFSVNKPPWSVDRKRTV